MQVFGKGNSFLLKRQSLFIIRATITNSEAPSTYSMASNLAANLENQIHTRYLLTSVMPHPCFVSKGSDKGQFLIQCNVIYPKQYWHIWAQFLNHPYSAPSLPATNHVTEYKRQYTFKWMQQPCGVCSHLNKNRISQIKKNEYDYNRNNTDIYVNSVHFNSTFSSSQLSLSFWNSLILISLWIYFLRKVWASTSQPSMRSESLAIMKKKSLHPCFK